MGFRLCLILTRDLCSLPPLQVAEEAVLGGADLIQVREKNCSASELYDWSRQVVNLGERLEVPVIINDSVEVAIATGASGVHLGQDDMPLAEARRILGDNKLIGLSTHDLTQLEQAAAEGADYAGFGPLFPSATKGYDHGLGPEKLAAATQATHLPLLAIGGITVDNVGNIHGKAGIAVSADICTSSEPRKIAHDLGIRCVY